MNLGCSQYCPFNNPFFLLVGIFECPLFRTLKSGNFRYACICECVWVWSRANACAYVCKDIPTAHGWSACFIEPQRLVHGFMGADKAEFIDTILFSRSIRSTRSRNRVTRFGRPPARSLLPHPINAARPFAQLSSRSDRETLFPWMTAAFNIEILLSAFADTHVVGFTRTTLRSASRACNAVMRDRRVKIEPASPWNNIARGDKAARARRCLCISRLCDNDSRWSRGRRRQRQARLSVAKYFSERNGKVRTFAIVDESPGDLCVTYPGDTNFQRTSWRRLRGV